MQEKKILRNIKLPDKFEIDGFIEVQNSDITFDKEPYTGRLENARYNSKILSTIIIEGVMIEFESNISHKLTDSELDELMIKLYNKQHTQNEKETNRLNTAND